MNEEILRNLNRKLDEAVDRGRKMVDDDELEERLEELKQRAEAYVRKNPLKSLAGGLLVGYVLGRLLSSDE